MACHSSHNSQEKLLCFSFLHLKSIQGSNCIIGAVPGIQYNIPCESVHVHKRHVDFCCNLNAQLHQPVKHTWTNLQGHVFSFKLIFFHLQPGMCLLCRVGREAVLEEAVITETRLIHPGSCRGRTVLGSRAGIRCKAGLSAVSEALE